VNALANFGQFIYGDTGADLIARMKKEDSTIVDVTSATSILLTWRAPDGTTGTISGSVVVPGSGGMLKFEDPAAVLNPGANPSVAIDFIVSYIISAETFKSRQIGRYEIVRFP